MRSRRSRLRCTSPAASSSSVTASAFGSTRSTRPASASRDNSRLTPLAAAIRRPSRTSPSEMSSIALAPAAAATGTTSGTLSSVMMSSAGRCVDRPCAHHRDAAPTIKANATPVSHTGDGRRRAVAPAAARSGPCSLFAPLPEAVRVRLGPDCPAREAFAAGAWSAAWASSKTESPTSMNTVSAMSAATVSGPSAAPLCCVSGAIAPVAGSSGLAER